MSQEKSFTKEYMHTVTEFDAVHPRFAQINPDEVTKYEKQHYYYCRQCKLYFAPTYEGLRIHFDKEIITHQPYGSCFYCRGKVYEYCINEESQVYHNCRRAKNK